MNNAQWIKEAEEQAKKYSDAIKNNSNYLIEQLNASKNNTLEQLQKQQDNALYNINANESSINSNAENLAKQENINRLLALKDNQSAMNRAGLGTQGVVGSQVNDINNSYGQNLNAISLNKANQLNELAKERNNTNLQYDTNRLNLTNEYDNNLANIQSQIDDKALNQYNDIYNTILKLKQQEYDNQQAEKAAQEKIRQYEEQFAYQKEQDKIAQQQWEKQYALNKAKLAENNLFGDNSVSSNKGVNGTSLTGKKSANGLNIVTNPYTGGVNPDTKYGVFNWNESGEGYMPDNVGGTKLEKTGNKVKDYLSGAISSDGLYSLAEQNLWKTSKGKYYVWDGTLNDYIDVTQEVKWAKDNSACFSWGATVPKEVNKVSDNKTIGYLDLKNSSIFPQNTNSGIKNSAKVPGGWV